MFIVRTLLVFLMLTAVTHAQVWQPITGEAALREIVSDTQLEGTLKNDVTGLARYNADGTAVLEAWGGSFDRTWRIEDDDRICVVAGSGGSCCRLQTCHGQLQIPRQAKDTNGLTIHQQRFRLLRTKHLLFQ